MRLTNVVADELEVLDEDLLLLGVHASEHCALSGQTIKFLRAVIIYQLETATING